MASSTGSRIQNCVKRLVLCLAALLCLAQPANAQNSASDFASDLNGVIADINTVNADAQGVAILPRYKAPPCTPNKKQTRDRLDELQSQLNDLDGFGKGHIRSFRAAGGGLPAATAMNTRLTKARSDAQASINAKRAALANAPVDPCPTPGTTGGAGAGAAGTTGSTGSTGGQPTTTSPPSGLTPPTLSTVPVPGPAPKFCTEEEKEKYLETLRSELEEANKNAGKADEFRDAVRQPVNGNPPNPDQVRQAEREAQARQAVFEALQRRYNEARNAEIVDCEESSGVGVLPGGAGTPGSPGATGGGGLPQQAADAESALNDAIKACDRAAAEAAAARLRQLLDAAWENLDRVRFGDNQAEIDRASKEYSDLFNREAAARERLAWMLENCREPSSTGFIPGSPPTIENHGEILPPVPPRKPERTDPPPPPFDSSGASVGTPAAEPRRTPPPVPPREPEPIHIPPKPVLSTPAPASGTILDGMAPQRAALDAAIANCDKAAFKAAKNQLLEELGKLLTRFRDNMHLLAERRRIEETQLPVPCSPGTQTIENHGEILTGTPEQRAARLEAIKQLRTGDANKSGTEVIPSLRKPDRDPSAQAREDAAARMNEAERDQPMVQKSQQPAASGPLAQEAKTDPPPTANPPPEEKQPAEEKPPADGGQPTRLPDVEAEDAPADFGGKGTVGGGLRDPTLEYRHIPLPPENGEGKEPAGTGSPPPVVTEDPGGRTLGTGPRKPRKPRRPRVDEPAEPIPPLQPDNAESSLDELEDYGPADDLRPDTGALEALAIEFNKARDACDLKTFLEVRARYIAELRRILGKPNLAPGAREHYDRLLKAAEETAVPVRVTLPCPVLIR